MYDEKAQKLKLHRQEAIFSSPNYKLDLSYSPPLPPPTFDLFTDTSSIDEGSTLVLTLTTTNIPDGTLVPYTITGVSGLDINLPLTGYFTVYNNLATLSVELSADKTTETSEEITITIDNTQETITIPVNDVSTSDEVGVNAAYIGFGGSTGGSTNEHWIHDFVFTNRYNTITFSQFKNNCQLINDATFIGSSLRLTEATWSQAGNAYYKRPIQLSEISTPTVPINWSVYYVFSMGGGSRADGITLIIQSESLLAGGNGGGIGYTGITKSIGISYDSFSNSFDPNNNHIELNVNGSVSSLITSQPDFNLCGTTGTDKYIYNWVDYINGIINVYVSETITKPPTPSLVYSLNIAGYVLS